MPRPKVRRTDLILGEQRVAYASQEHHSYEEGNNSLGRHGCSFALLGQDGRRLDGIPCQSRGLIHCWMGM